MPTGPPTKDFLLDPSLVRLLWTLFPMKPWPLGLCVHLCVTQFYQESCQLGLARIPPHPWCFLLVIIYSLTTPTWLIGYKFLLAYAVFGIDPSSSSQLQDSIAVVPIPNHNGPPWINSALLFFNKYHEQFFLTGRIILFSLTIHQILFPSKTY